MVTISFPNWSDALAAADYPDKVRNRHRIIRVKDLVSRDPAVFCYYVLSHRPYGPMLQ